MREKNIPKELISEWLKYAPMLTCNIVIEDRGWVLLVKRNDEPEKNKWFTPGGIITKTDDIDEQVKDIVNDECGIAVILKRTGFMEEYHKTGYGSDDIRLCTLLYRATMTGNKQIPKTNEDHCDIRWFKLSSQTLCSLADAPDNVSSAVIPILYEVLK